MVYENINNIGSFGEPGYCVNHRRTRRGGGILQKGKVGQFLVHRTLGKKIADGGGEIGVLQRRETF